MTPQPALSDSLDAALENTTTLLAWIDLAPRGINTYLAIRCPWGEESWLPLHRAAQGGHTNAVKQLLQAGAQPDSRTRFVTPMHARQTALHLAAAANHTPIITALLDADAQIEVRDARSRSPLWEAARAGHHHAVNLLLSANAVIDAPDTGGRTPLHAALMPVANNTPPFNADAALKTITALLAAGANPNAVCPREPAGYTPLLRCVKLGKAADAIAQALRTAGADAQIMPPK
ncbi:MAG: ankyrin repeat domain-containing protein [Algisphaera sp.]